VRGTTQADTRPSANAIYEGGWVRTNLDALGGFPHCRHYTILTLDDGLTRLLESENEPDIVRFFEDGFSIDYVDTKISNLLIKRTEGIFI
jgi:hypothetical protein